MDYTARYGLEFNRFLKNSKEVLVETQEYKEVLFRLNYLLATKGFGLLTGSAGRGKTTAIRSWSAGRRKLLHRDFLHRRKQQNRPLPMGFWNPTTLQAI